MIDMINSLSKSPGSIIFISSVFGLLVFITNRFLLASLLRMHRSKTAVKKIEKKYTFKQRFLLHHVRDYCKHATRFTKWMIVIHHVNLAVTLLVSALALLSCCVASLGIIAAWVLIAQLAIVVFPVFISEFFLTKHPFNKRKREYRFTDYHNTDDHESVF